MTTTPYNVLFLCTHNAGRSIMAECLLRRLAPDRFAAFSAGSEPAGRINPIVRDLLERHGFDTANLRSKSWDEFTGPDAPRFDFVFTLCDDAAGESCPVFPGQPLTAHWPFADPSQAAGSEAEKRAFVADIFRQVQRRLEIFASLPLASLDRLSTQRRLAALGRDELPQAG